MCLNEATIDCRNLKEANTCSGCAYIQLKINVTPCLALNIVEIQWILGINDAYEKYFENVIKKM